ncbi:hypothetical protein BC938DRAFT_471111, partial [Jimgerdemannia flammicorona]
MEEIAVNGSQEQIDQDPAHVSRPPSNVVESSFGIDAKHGDVQLSSNHALSRSQPSAPTSATASLDSVSVPNASEPKGGIVANLVTTPNTLGSPYATKEGDVEELFIGGEQNSTLASIDRTVSSLTLSSLPSIAREKPDGAAPVTIRISGDQTDDNEDDEHHFKDDDGGFEKTIRKSVDGEQVTSNASAATSTTALTCTKYVFDQQFSGPLKNEPLPDLDLTNNYFMFTQEPNDRDDTPKMVLNAKIVLATQIDIEAAQLRDDLNIWPHSHTFKNVGISVDDKHIVTVCYNDVTVEESYSDEMKRFGPSYDVEICVWDFNTSSADLRWSTFRSRRIRIARHKQLQVTASRGGEVVCLSCGNDSANDFFTLVAMQDGSDDIIPTEFQQPCVRWGQFHAGIDRFMLANDLSIVHFYDTNTWALIYAFDMKDLVSTQLAPSFSEDGKQLATIFDSLDITQNIVDIWWLNTEQLRCRITLPLPQQWRESLHSNRFSPNGDTLVIAVIDNIHVCSLNTSIRSIISYTAFAPDFKTLQKINLLRFKTDRHIFFDITFSNSNFSSCRCLFLLDIFNTQDPLLGRMKLNDEDFTNGDVLVTKFSEIVNNKTSSQLRVTSVGIIDFPRRFKQCFSHYFLEEHGFTHQHLSISPEGCIKIKTLNQDPHLFYIGELYQCTVHIVFGDDVETTFRVAIVDGASVRIVDIDVNNPPCNVDGDRYIPCTKWMWRDIPPSGESIIIDGDIATMKPAPVILRSALMHGIDSEVDTQWYIRLEDIFKRSYVLPISSNLTTSTFQMENGGWQHFRYLSDKSVETEEKQLRRAQQLLGEIELYLLNTAPWGSYKTSPMFDLLVLWGKLDQWDQEWMDDILKKCFVNPRFEGEVLLSLLNGDGGKHVLRELVSLQKPEMVNQFIQRLTNIAVRGIHKNAKTSQQQRFNIASYSWMEMLTADFDRVCHSYPDTVKKALETLRYLPFDRLQKSIKKSAKDCTLPAASGFPYGRSVRSTHSELHAFAIPEQMKRRSKIINFASSSLKIMSPFQFNKTPHIGISLLLNCFNSQFTHLFPLLTINHNSVTTCVVPLPGFTKYERCTANDNFFKCFWKHWMKPQSQFTKQAFRGDSPIFVTIPMKAIINFKWRTFAKKRFIIVFGLFLLFFAVFAAAAILPMDAPNKGPLMW